MGAKGQEAVMTGIHHATLGRVRMLPALDNMLDLEFVTDNK